MERKHLPCIKTNRNFSLNQSKLEGNGNNVLTVLGHVLARPRLHRFNIYLTSLLRPVHTTAKEFKNGGFTLKTHQMFSIHNTTKET